MDMTGNAVAKQIVDVAYRAHRVLGPGLLESVYEAVLASELEKRGLRVARQQLILTYPRLADKRLGLLINFNVALIKDGITRVVNGLEE